MNYNQRLKLSVAVLGLLVLGWWAAGRVAVAPGQNKPPESAATNPAETVSSGKAVVTKVLDGDTIIIQGGVHVRLLGIDADEKDYPCYDAGRLRLEELILGKTVALEADRENLDQYGRQLRYIFLNGENINQKMAAEGLAIARFYPENQKYKIEIAAAEAAAIKNKIGCKWEGRSQN
jgi:micrococcal nuclease